jgi:hypothetical protein
MRPAICPSHRYGHVVDIRYPFWINNGDNMDGAANDVWWIDLTTQTALHSQIGADLLLVLTNTMLICFTLIF